MLITVPGNVAAKFVPIKLARLVIVNVRDRAQDVGQSKILGGFGSDPAVRGIEILITIVVVIEHRRTPVPAKWIRVRRL